MLAQDVHPGWRELARRIYDQRITRRQFLSGTALASALSLGPATLFPTKAAGALGGIASPLPDQANWPSTTPIKHIVILCQENRTFDHYFGSFANTLGLAGHTAKGFSPSKVYRDASGAPHHPFHLTQFCNDDPDHSWEGSHAKWNGGAMDGFVTAENGATTAIGCFDAGDHIYHVQLAHAFTLADHHFCSQIGPTLPNRLYLWTGTSGWDFLEPATTASSLPYNNPSLTAPPPVLNWTTMGDVLDAVGLPWKCYSVADGSVPSAIGAFNPLIFFSQILTNPAKLAKATAEISEFFADLAAGTLPAVSWIVTEAVVSEHPPAPPDMGQLLAARVVDALMHSSAWASSVLFLTYDEGGGFFDTVPPKIRENVPEDLPDAGAAVGPGFRVPLFVVSPWARPGTVFKGVTDHTSILQFAERNFSTNRKPVHLPTIGALRRKQANLAQAFDFTQAPITPALPTAQQLFASANQTVLTLDATRTIPSCATSLPSWLGPLLGV